MGTLRTGTFIRGLMSKQSKRDLIVAVAICSMFLGAFILPTTWLGFVLIGGGGLVALVLLLIVALEKQ